MADRAGVMGERDVRRHVHGADAVHGRRVLYGVHGGDLAAQPAGLVEVVHHQVHDHAAGPGHVAVPAGTGRRRRLPEEPRHRDVADPPGLDRVVRRLVRREVPTTWAGYAWTPAASARRSPRASRPRSSVSGFSQITFLPALIAASVISLCVADGVTMSTNSASARPPSSDAATSSPYCSASSSAPSSE